MGQLEEYLMYSVKLYLRYRSHKLINFYKLMDSREKNVVH